MKIIANLYYRKWFIFDEQITSNLKLVFFKFFNFIQFTLIKIKIYLVIFLYIIISLSIHIYYENINFNYKIGQLNNIAGLSSFEQKVKSYKQIESRKPKYSTSSSYIEDILDGNNIYYKIFFAHILKADFDQRLRLISFRCKARFIQTSVKSFTRIFEKAKFEYKRNLNKVRDILRGSLIFENLNDLYEALPDLYRNFNVLKVKDRFKNIKSSYKDVNILVELNDNFKAEIQLHLQHIFSIKNIETPIYNKIRSLQIEILKNPTNVFFLKKEIKKLEVKRNKLYHNAWQSYKKSINFTS